MGRRGARKEKGLKKEEAKDSRDWRSIKEEGQMQKEMLKENEEGRKDDGRKTNGRRY